MSKREPGRLVFVEWEDSCGVSTSWEFLDEMDEPKTVLITSVGWVVRETDELISISPNLSRRETPNQVCGTMTIPRTSVRRLFSMSEKFWEGCLEYDYERKEGRNE